MRVTWAPYGRVLAIHVLGVHEGLLRCNGDSSSSKRKCALKEGTYQSESYRKAVGTANFVVSAFLLYFNIINVEKRICSTYNSAKRPYYSLRTH